MQRALFISSTFRDMQPERDILSRIVLPALRAAPEAGPAAPPEIDLRWGVTTRMARDGGAVRVCLEAVRRCAPALVGIVGRRVGWRPEPRHFLDADPELAARLPQGWGLTGAELACAALCAGAGAPPMPVFLRQDDPAPDEAEDAEAAGALRGWIADNPRFRAVRYRGLDAFEQVARAEIARLVAALERLPPAPAAAPAR